MNRRNFLTTAAALAVTPSVLSARSGTFEVTRTDAEWRSMLSGPEYDVMRREGTERAFSSVLNDVTEPGTFHCKGCDQALYATEAKFESGTGWPSFTRPLDNAIETKPDPGLFGTRTEVHCDRCGSHMGHVFDDGPEPTGMRYCMNGIAMFFEPAGGGKTVTG